MHLLVPPAHRVPTVGCVADVAALLVILDALVSAGSMVVLHVDGAGALRCLVTLDDLGPDDLTADPGLVFRTASASGAERLWLVTVGRSAPGDDDADRLDALRRAGRARGVPVVDWVLTAADGTSSVAAYAATRTRRASP